MRRFSQVLKWWVVLLLSDLLFWLLMMMGLLIGIFKPPPPPGSDVKSPSYTLLVVTFLALLLVISEVLLFLGAKMRSATQLGWGLVIRVLFQLNLLLSVTALFLYNAFLCGHRGVSCKLGVLCFAIFVIYLVAGSSYVSYRVHEHCYFLRDKREVGVQTQVEDLEEQRLEGHQNLLNFPPLSNSNPEADPSQPVHPSANRLAEVVVVPPSP